MHRIHTLFFLFPHHRFLGNDLEAVSGFFTTEWSLFLSFLLVVTAVHAYFRTNRGRILSCIAPCSVVVVVAAASVATACILRFDILYRDSGVSGYDLLDVFSGPPIPLADKTKRSLAFGHVNRFTDELVRGASLVTKL